MVGIIAGGLTVFFILVGILQHHPRFHKAFQNVFHLKDGRFCYGQHTAAGGGDSWFWLWNTTQKNYYRSDKPLRDRLPDDTAWICSTGDASTSVQGRPNPEEEEEINEESTGKAAGEEQEQIVESETDEPASIDEGGNSAASDESAGGSSGGDEGGGGADEGGGGGGGDDD